MQLKQIKLAGFKSFVDPTVLHFNSRLVGVVGPNGCGKSNIIDAVRWVMGEVSAKNLRGSSMDDVIFNGSSSRKPVGVASIDLIFDNSSGSAGGEYAKYAEIGIRREVSRDKGSHYFINGTRCRRRDVVDIFLGTGLGSRSYSIIEQGMISRVIEAKPEQLREFVEEAAGISLYKKRRHDTEIRMRHTQENLERLQDLNEQQAKLLAKLTKQAAAAEKYNELNSERKTTEAELLHLKWQNFADNSKQLNLDIKDATLVLEEMVASKTKLDTEVTQDKQEHETKNSAFQEAQQKFYTIGEKVVRAEEKVQSTEQRILSQRSDLQELKQQLTSIDTTIATDNSELQQTQEKLAELEPDFIAQTESYNTAKQELDNANEHMATWVAAWEEFHTSSSKLRSYVEVERERIASLETTAQTAKLRQDELELERRELAPESAKEEYTAKKTEITAATVAADETNNAIEVSNGNLNAYKAELNAHVAAIDERKELLQINKGKLASLQALQDAALGMDSAVAKWQEQAGLADYKRLAELLQVANGFELAVEIALGQFLTAWCLPDLSTIELSKLEQAPIAASFVKVMAEASSNFSGKYELEPLASKIVAPAIAQDILQGFYIAEDGSQASRLAVNLQPGEYIVTVDGLLFSSNALTIPKAVDAGNSIIARQGELQDLTAAITSCEQDLAKLTAEKVALEDKIKAEEAAVKELRNQSKEQQKVLQSLAAAVSSLQTRYEHVTARFTQIATELQKQQEIATKAGVDAKESRAKLSSAIEEMDALQTKEEELLADKLVKQGALSRAQEAAELAREDLHTLEIAKEKLLSSETAMTTSIERLQQQRTSIMQKITTLEEKLASGDEPLHLAKTKLEEFLSSKLTAEETLNSARIELEMIDAKLQAAEKTRAKLEQNINAKRESLNELRLEWQSLDVRKETLQEQINALDCDMEMIAKNIPEEAGQAVWEDKFKELTLKIEKLGPINQAAVEEYKLEQERQEYLDSQLADLTEALATLETAIRKIDKETRTQFNETFTKINTSFQYLFPKLFGGGRADLALTEDDVLTAGVTVMAQPPGKRNSSIHLLSGGEKALTAVALVFSIFQLNPAPFCMLDEVDAPLDDANVGRYCKMIQEMSEKVQFIFITHNKLTMEIAEQLSGVTMKEPGVSRLVSVDIAKAMELAEA